LARTDLAGVVETVGTSVTRFRPGDIERRESQMLVAGVTPSKVVR
jgi:hypothetical protein